MSVLLTNSPGRFYVASWNPPKEWHLGIACLIRDLLQTESEFLVKSGPELWSPDSMVTSTALPGHFITNLEVPGEHP